MYIYVLQIIELCFVYVSGVFFEETVWAIRTLDWLKGGMGSSTSPGGMLIKPEPIGLQTYYKDQQNEHMMLYSDKLLALI